MICALRLRPCSFASRLMVRYTVCGTFLTVIFMEPFWNHSLQLANSRPAFKPIIARMRQLAGIISRETLIVMRGFRREPGYAAISILLLAVGIGFTSAVFTLLWQAVYASLPVPDPSRLYTLSTNVTHNGRSESDAPGGPADVFSLPTYRYLTANFSSSSGIVARHGELVNIETPQGPHHCVLTSSPEISSQSWASRPSSAVLFLHRTTL
jgi:hypothetical protein